MSDVQLSEYVSGRLSDSEMARLQRVLDSCDYCRQELLTWETTISALRNLPELGLPRSFVMLEAPAPAQARSQGSAFNPLLGLGRLPALSPWVYAGAASIAALAGALIITTQGGLPWAGTGEGLMSDAATEEAAVAVATRMDSGAESLTASQAQIVPTPPQAAASAPLQVEERDERVSAMAARSMVTREAASRKTQAVPQDLSKEASPVVENAQHESEVLAKAAQPSLPQAATSTPQAIAALAPAAVPASAEVDAEVEVERVIPEEPRSAEAAPAGESPAVESQAEPPMGALVVGEAASDSGLTAAPSGGYALDAAQTPTATPAPRESATQVAQENPSAQGARGVTGAIGSTPAHEQREEAGPASGDGKEGSQDQPPSAEGQESRIKVVGAIASVQEADTSSPQQERIEGEDGTEVGQVLVTPEPPQKEQATEDMAQSEKLPNDTGLETGGEEPTLALSGNDVPEAPATPLITPEAASRLAVSPQGEMAARAEEKRKAAATGPGTDETGAQGDGQHPQQRATEETAMSFVWVVAGLLTLVALALAGYLGYQANRSRKPTD